MIKVQELSKHFEDKKRGIIKAVDNISFEVNPGEIFGLLGTNGAGKTTTLRMLASIFKPTSGTAQIVGYDVSKSPDEVRKNIGFLSGDTNLYVRLTAKEVLKYYAELHGMKKDKIISRIDELVKVFEMEEFIDRKIAKLSTGQRQRVSIGRAIIQDPQLMIFDEPTSGLDPISARHIVDFIRTSRTSGRTILFSTHILHEAEKLCDRIAIIHNGRIGAYGTLSEIYQKTNSKDLEEAFFKIVDQANNLS